MARVQLATPDSPERVALETNVAVAQADPPRLLKTLRALDARGAAGGDRLAPRAYLADTAAPAAALELLEAKLGPTATGHEVLEGYLRNRFAVYDRGGGGFIDMADFAHLLALLKDVRSQEDVDREMMLIDVDDNGKIPYTAFVKWWLA